MLTAEQILAAANGKQLEPIREQAWGGDICLLRMTADQSDAMHVYWRENGNAETGEGWRAFVVAWCLCDESGVATFRSADGDEHLRQAWQKFRNADVSTIDRLFERAARVNGILPAEDTAKN